MVTQHSAIADFAALGGTLEIAVGAQRTDPRVALLTAEARSAILTLHPDALSRDAESLIEVATFRLLWFRAVGPDRDGWERVGARRRWRLTIRLPR